MGGFVAMVVDIVLPPARAVGGLLFRSADQVWENRLAQSRGGSQLNPTPRIEAVGA
ncbi:MAG: hypothetical protein V7646_5436 [Pseudonocardia sp.]|jgi:hypothetical protein